MKSINIVKLRARLSEFINTVAYRGERVVLLRHGHPVAVLVGISDLNKLLELDQLQKELDAKAAHNAKATILLNRMHAPEDF